MHKKKHVVLIIALLCVSGFTPMAHADDSGRKAPAVELQGTQGKYKLSESKAKLTYLDFWASWCGPCKQSFPWMNSMQEKYGNKGLDVVAVNLDANTQDAQTFLKNMPANFKVLFDASGATPKQFGVKGMPTSYLIDADGNIVLQHMGFNDKDKVALEEKIKQVLDGK